MITKKFNIKIDRDIYGIHKSKFIFIETDNGGDVYFEIDEKVICRDTYVKPDNKFNDYVNTMLLLLGKSTIGVKEDSLYALIIASRDSFIKHLNETNFNIEDYLSIIVL